MRAKCQHSVVIGRQKVSALCRHRKTERLLLPMNVVDWMQTNIGTDSEREAAHANKLDSQHSLVSEMREMPSHAGCVRQLLRDCVWIRDDVAAENDFPDCRRALDDGNEGD
jgi:hypothetical protein